MPYPNDMRDRFRTLQPCISVRHRRPCISMKRVDPDHARLFALYISRLILPRTIFRDTGHIVFTSIKICFLTVFARERLSQDLFFSIYPSLRQCPCPFDGAYVTSLQ